ncbi:MAG: sulfotransferase domain-containing protein [Aestuariivirga sp.]|uniref:sulfotransferase domain-containing protein n=1 Tax=Aestuariivirga sp. TaxID=2650926 RepID=UPI0025C02C58|nr:sulfotransferase domain-containing protein [Aestuariivirga sp.]MCA3559496.1 sulfotransferase domain-containing protein [Aestuariivirga sp.]
MPLPNSFDLRTGLRQLVSHGSVLLPRETGIRAERWFRGYEEMKKLKAAGGAIVSFGKSGRTWVRVLLWRYFAKKNGYAGDSISGFDEFRNRHPQVPVLFFTHDNYLKDYLGHDRKAEIYAGLPVVLLVRDPRDTAVSQFFQWKHRMAARKKVINGYPLSGDASVHDFIAGAQAGLPKIIGFMNDWAAAAPKMKRLLVVRYEDLRADTKGQLRRILDFLGQHPADADLDDAVSFASIDNMRRMEIENAGKAGAQRSMKPGNADEPSSFKVRRGKVGGWRDYVTQEQAAALDNMVRERLNPVYGYNS